MDIAESSHGTVVAMCHSSGLGQKWKDCACVPSAKTKDGAASADSQVTAAWLMLSVARSCGTTEAFSVQLLDCLPKMVLETSGT